MKKLLALALALALCLGLAVPALAAETEVFYIDGQPVEIIPAGEYIDPYDAYQAAHPEEMAALDIDQLLKDWDYEDRTAEEQFMKAWGGAGESLEEAVVRLYTTYRLNVADTCELAQEYKVEYPQQWESFDLDAYMEEAW